MAIDRIQRRGFVRDIVSLASNNLDRFLHKSLVSASIISIKSADIFAYSEWPPSRNFASFKYQYSSFAFKEYELYIFFKCSVCYDKLIMFINPIRWVFGILF